MPRNRPRACSQQIACDLIALAYEAAVDPALWDEFIRQFADAVGASLSGLFFHDGESGKGDFAVSHQVDPYYHKLYSDHFSSVNIWMKRMKHLTESGDLRNSLIACSNDELVRTEFYNEWLRPQNLFYGFGGTILREQSLTTNITAMRPRSREPFGREETALLELLMPHLQRALGLHRHLATVDAGRLASFGLLDQIAAGAAIVTRDARVVFLNRTAQQIANRKDGLIVGRSGLSVAKSGENIRLRNLIAEADKIACGLKMKASLGNLTVSRPSRRSPFSLQVIPLRLEYSRQRLLAGRETPAAIVIINDPDADVAPESEVLCQQFRLTRAETRLASILMNGKSMEGAASEMSISMNTARTHLKRVLSKTGTNRQGELIHLLLRRFAIFRSARVL